MAAIVGTGASGIQISLRSSPGRRTSALSAHPAVGGPAHQRRAAGVAAPGAGTVPGLAPLRLGIYWAQEALAYGMTKRLNTLKIIEACQIPIFVDR